MNIKHNNKKNNLFIIIILFYFINHYVHSIFPFYFIYFQNPLKI